MPRSAELVLQAVARFEADRAEDRLTEIFATVLRHDRDLASWYCSEANVELLGDHAYEVLTQVSLGGLRLDMQLVVWNLEGVRLGRVWSEHKAGADFEPDQLAKYADATGDCGMAIVPDALPVPQDERRRWSKVTWSDVARSAHKIGCQRGGGRWRRDATAPEAPARQRVLHEFIDYLERKDLQVHDFNPVQHLDVIAYGRGDAARDKVRGIFHAACDLLSRQPAFAGDSDSTAPAPRGGTGGWYVQYPGPADWWRDLPEVAFAWGEFLVAPTDEWKRAGLDEPAFGAGLSFGHPPYGSIGWPRALDQVEHADWRSDLEENGITVGETDSGHVGRMFKTLYLSELMSKGTDRDRQTGFLADWARASIEDVAARHPPSA